MTRAYFSRLPASPESLESPAIRNTVHVCPIIMIRVRMGMKACRSDTAKIAERSESAF